MSAKKEGSRHDDHRGARGSPHEDTGFDRRRSPPGGANEPRAGTDQPAGKGAVETPERHDGEVEEVGGAENDLGRQQRVGGEPSPIRVISATPSEAATHAST